MKVKVVDYGVSDDPKKYYVTYKITDIDEESINKLKNRVEEELDFKSGDLYLTAYFNKEYYPFGSEESKYRSEDFIAREEIEMWAYLMSLLED
ncbi:DUF5750 family protein [Methanobacterium sp. MBAC-LM]|jgi:hypothetical protein|uniref:DUF5750 family protein n=1 Tax=Methanobacterium sp. MBAC-LM TaxID=3412034 RepID=UPI003C771F44